MEAERVRSDASWAVSTPKTTVNTAVAMAGVAAGEVASQQHDLHLEQPAEISAHWVETATQRDAIDVLRSISQAEETALNQRGLEWLLKSQHVFASPLTGGPAGGWGASDAAGAEPTAFATSAALIALRQFYGTDAANNLRIEPAASAGV